MRVSWAYHSETAKTHIVLEVIDYILQKHWYNKCVGTNIYLNLIVDMDGNLGKKPVIYLPCRECAEEMNHGGTSRAENVL
jgi:hypothetical protein